MNGIIDVGAICLIAGLVTVSAAVLWTLSALLCIKRELFYTIFKIFGYIAAAVFLLSGIVALITVSQEEVTQTSSHETYEIVGEPSYAQKAAGRTASVSVINVPTEDGILVYRADTLVVIQEEADTFVVTEYRSTRSLGPFYIVSKETWAETQLLNSD